MNRSRPTHLRVVGPMPGVHSTCDLCRRRVRRIGGAVYEASTDAYHACRGGWDVLPPAPPTWRERVRTWVGRVISW